MQHPEMLMDMLDREKALENMWAFPYTDKHLIQAEAADMMHNDIPVFSAGQIDQALYLAVMKKFQAFI